MVRARPIDPPPYDSLVRARRQRARDAVAGLDEDAVQVLRMVGLAMTDDEIGTALGVSRQRVGRVRRGLVVSLRVSCPSAGGQRVELARIAMRAGLSSLWSVPE